MDEKKKKINIYEDKSWYKVDINIAIFITWHITMWGWWNKIFADDGQALQQCLGLFELIFLFAWIGFGNESVIDLGFDLGGDF
jgi:hypothetical protein